MKCPMMMHCYFLLLSLSLCASLSLSLSLSLYQSILSWLPPFFLSWLLSARSLFLPCSSLTEILESVSDISVHEEEHEGKHATMTHSSPDEPRRDKVAGDKV